MLPQEIFFPFTKSTPGPALMTEIRTDVRTPACFPKGSSGRGSRQNAGRSLAVMSMAEMLWHCSSSPQLQVHVAVTVSLRLHGKSDIVTAC
jgi:hypothetical protein